MANGKINANMMSLCFQLSFMSRLANMSSLSVQIDNLKANLKQAKILIRHIAYGTFQAKQKFKNRIFFVSLANGVLFVRM